MIDLVAAKSNELDRQSGPLLESALANAFGIPAWSTPMRLNTRRRPISIALDSVLGFQLAPAPILRRKPALRLVRVEDFRQPPAPASSPKPIRGQRERARHLKQRFGL